MIDDNEVLRSAASKLLRTQGFRVLEADFWGNACNHSPPYSEIQNLRWPAGVRRPLEIHLRQGEVI